MQATANNACTSYSDLPILCTRNICDHLGAEGCAPIVRVREVNQDFLQESRIPLARSVIKELKSVDSRNLSEPEDRLREFQKYMGYAKNTDGLPDELRKAVLQELCRIVNTLPNQWFNAGWRDMVAQFHAESEGMRAALTANMNKLWGRVELYGDGSVKFDFQKPSPLDQ